MSARVVAAGSGWLRGPWLLAVVVGGIVLRTLQFIGGASLSSDEAMLALNVLHRSYGDLFHRLDFNQAAPLGLLVVEKLAADAGGSSDLALRTVPFAAGVLALVVFPALARRVLSSSAAVALATFLFAVSDPLVYWTATDKQYAVDVLAAVLLPLLALRLLDRRRRRDWFGFGVACVLAPFLSHASAFVIAASLTSVALGGLLRHAPREWAATAIAALASFALAYELSRSDLHGIQASLSGTPGAFAGGSDPSIVYVLLGVFRYLAGIPPVLSHGARDLGEEIAALAIVFCVLGIVAIARRAPAVAGVIFFPIVFWAVASVAGKYPLLSRTMMFALPETVLALTAGIFAATRARRRSLAGAAAVAAAAVVATSAADAAKHLGSPRTRQEMEPVLAYLAAHERPGDGLYVFYKAQYGFRFYLECGCSSSPVRRARRLGLWPVRPAPGGSEQWARTLVSTGPRRLTIGSDLNDDPAAYARQVVGLRSRERVWVVASDLSKGARHDLLTALDRVAKRRATFVGGSDEGAAGAYLYVFS